MGANIVYLPSLFVEYCRMSLNGLKCWSSIVTIQVKPIQLHSGRKKLSLMGIVITVLGGNIEMNAEERNRKIWEQATRKAVDQMYKTGVTRLQLEQYLKLLKATLQNVCRNFG